MWPETRTSLSCLEAPVKEAFTLPCMLLAHSALLLFWLFCVFMAGAPSALMCNLPTQQNPTG